jgi:hypothetical protein
MKEDTMSLLLVARQLSIKNGLSRHKSGKRLVFFVGLVGQDSIVTVRHRRVQRSLNVKLVFDIFCIGGRDI